MTHEELITEIVQLPLHRRRAVLEAIARSVEAELQSTQNAQAPESAHQPSIDERMSVVNKLYGILKFEGEPPTDEELKDEYANYLLEKYS